MMNQGGPGSVGPSGQQGLGMPQPHGGQPSPMMMMASPAGGGMPLTPQPMTPHQGGPPSVGPPPMSMMGGHSPMPGGQPAMMSHGHMQQHPGMQQGHMGMYPGSMGMGMPHPQQLQHHQMQQQQQQQQQPAPPPVLTYKDMNAAYLCRLGAELSQEIITRTLDLLSMLKTLANNINNQQIEERKAKTRELSRIIEAQFGKIRKVYERIEECSAPYQGLNIESLLAVQLEGVKLDQELESSDEDDEKDEVKIKSEDDEEMEEPKISKKKTAVGKSSSLITVTPGVYISDEQRRANPKLVKMEQEYADLVELNKLKHRQMKEVIDRLRQMVWDINTLLAVRKP